MPTADLADIIKSLSPLIFTSAAEAPVSNTRWYVVHPGDDDGDDGWGIAYRTEAGWFANDGMPREPLLCAALPPSPLKPRAALKHLAAELTEHIDAGEFDRAVKLIDQLAGVVKAMRHGNGGTVT